MAFIADLHVHSKYSRATAKLLDLEHLYISARRKGISVVATGDFTHPAWMAEIREKLVPAEPGLFRLKDHIRRKLDPEVPESCSKTVRFILETEISNIYKKDGSTRKNHNLIYVPDFGTAEAFNARLDAVGNITSDGRPILGLDAKHLLEIMLECSDQAFLIPAHIWTPWFSLLGSRSGFDALASCYEELSHWIFAVETGLSSDPPMNWRVSELDTRTLVSNSDAHSPANLGRNANIFETELSFFGIREALASQDPARCLGTIDMYPEEGKYHMDGHRKCGHWQHPSDGAGTGHICPVCNHPLTLGVLHRVEQLADRPAGAPPTGRPPFYHLIPLGEILSEIFGVGVNTKTVARHHQHAIERLGPELFILKDLPLERIRQANIPLLDEAIRRMRAGLVHVSPGFDGEYGRVRVFEKGEKEKLMGQASLFPRIPPQRGGRRAAAAPDPISRPPRATGAASEETAGESAESTPAEKSPPGPADAGILGSLNDAQRSAVVHEKSPLLIIAGPGTGKTRTLTHRIAHLMHARGAAGDRILAVTFTNKAAREMKTRLEALLAPLSPQGFRPTAFPVIGTFHGFCLGLLREIEGKAPAIADEDTRQHLLHMARDRHLRTFSGSAPSLRHLSAGISSAKQYLLGPEDDLTAVKPPETAAIFRDIYRDYQRLLDIEGLVDFEDLIMGAVCRLEADPGLRGDVSGRYLHVLVDEYQDINPAQYRLLRLLCPETHRGLFVIGDPDQSIYGFRGSDVTYFQRFREDYPGSRVFHLSRNYRSTETILDAAHHMIRKHSLNSSDIRTYSNIKGIRTLTVMSAPTETAEAVAVGRMIESMVGGFGFQSIDFGSAGATAGRDRSFSDFGVLYRSHAQGRVFAEVLRQAGIPCQVSHREDIYGQPGLRELISLCRLASGSGIITDVEHVCRLPDFGWDEKDIGEFRDWCNDRNLPVKAMLGEGGDPAASVEGHRIGGRLLRMRKTLGALRMDIQGMRCADALEHLAASTGIRERLHGFPERTAALESLIRRCAGTPGASLSDVASILALDTDADLHDAAAEKVALMTFHASKGLEFPVVFIAGCEDGFLPFRHRDHRCEDMAEERRLFYVGITRAMDQLFLTSAKMRFIHGRSEKRTLSPFVSDIERQLLHHHAGSTRPPRKAGMQLGLFPEP